MQRREVLIASSGVVAALAGCGARSDVADDTDPTTTTEPPMSLDRVEGTYPEGLQNERELDDGGPTFGYDGSTGALGLSGTVEVPNSCHELEAPTGSYQAGALTVSLGSVDTSAKNEVCTMAIAELPYSVGAFFDGFSRAELDSITLEPPMGDPLTYDIS